MALCECIIDIETQNLGRKVHRVHSVNYVWSYLQKHIKKNLVTREAQSLHSLSVPCQVSEESCRAQFLVPVTAQGQNRAQASLERAQNLNPMVEVHADSTRVEDKPDDFFLQFDAVSDIKVYSGQPYSNTL